MDPANRMRALLYYAISAKVARGLTDKGYSVSGPTVSRWAKGQKVTPHQVRLVEELLTEKMGPLGHATTAAPDWERLQRTVDAIAERVGVSLEQAAVAGADVVLPQLPAGGSTADPQADEPVGEAPRGRRRR